MLPKGVHATKSIQSTVTYSNPGFSYIETEAHEKFLKIKQAE